jgi:hypothetical protein
MGNHKVDVVEISAVVLLLIFTIVIGQYHISYDRFRGLSYSEWNTVWAIAENFLTLIMSTLVSIYAGSGMLRLMFNYIFIPYFAVKLFYHFTMFAGIHTLSKESWENIWSWICWILLNTGLFYCLMLIKKYRKNVAKIFKFKMV